MRKIMFSILIFISSLASVYSSAAPAVANNAMVVTTQHLATNVGLSILKQGGNAVDAAVAIGYALAVVEPCCGNIGGGGFMLIHLADGQNKFINFREKAPLNIKQNLYKTSGNYDLDKIRTGYLAAGIPGTVMGLNYALKKYGTMPLSKVMQPAINLANSGFKLSSGDVTLLKESQDLLQQHANVARIFLKNGKPYQVGDILKQQQLAKTLSLIATQGSAAFYHGTIAKELVAASQKHGGVFSMQDFTNYTTQELTPITCKYRSYSIISSPPPSSGGITLCEMLNILSAYPLNSMGFHSPLSVHYIAEAMRYAYADRNEYLGDPDFVKNPTAKLTSPEYAASIRKKILANRAGNSRTIGFINKPTREKPQTTSYAVVDKFGNAVEVTYTLNGPFGSGVMAEKTGFLLNGDMDDFTLRPNIPNSFGLIQSDRNKIAPGKRPLSSMSPTIVLKNKKLFIVTGAAGGSTIITQVLTSILNVIDYHLNIAKAIDAPRFHMQWLPDVIFMEPHAFSKTTKKKLLQMGYRFHLGSPYAKDPYWGISVAILKKGNIFYGAEDKRWPGGLAKGD